MKFVGGPKHGDEVPAWALNRSDVYFDGHATRNANDGTWTHTRLRYIRQTWLYPDGHKIPFFAVADETPIQEIEDSARMLLEPE